MKRAYFAGGCFWCITPAFKYIGAENVISGYAGGEEENPAYEDVKSQKTGHRETICVEYDSEKVSYKKLLSVFLTSVDPYDEGGQYIDRGFSYTLAIFYNDEEEKQLAESEIARLEETSGKKVFVAVLPYKNFYRAEEYHQDYYLKNPEAFERELEESGRKVIRLAKEEDLDRIEEIYNLIHIEEAAGRVQIGWIPGVYPVRGTAEEALARGDLFVAEMNGKVVASAILNKEQVDCYRMVHFAYSAEDDDVMVMHTLVVDPNFGRRGIGAWFEDFYEKYAREHGCHVLRIDTQTKNVRARAMYRKLGYREAEAVPCEFNGIPDVMLMVLEKKI